MEGKTKIHNARHLISCIHNISRGGTTRKEYTNMSHGRIICILFSEQAVYERGTKWKNAYLASISNIAIVMI